jgi:predicted MFS family arabinose efflux permease
MDAPPHSIPDAAPSDSAAPALAPRQESLLLYTLAAVNFTHIMDFTIMMPLGPNFMRVFGIDASRFGLLVSSYTFSASISGLAGAFFIDRYDRKAALLTLYAGFILGTLACAFCDSFGWLVAARTLTGAFGGVLGATVLAMIGDAFPPHRRGIATGTVMAAFSAASIAGVPFGLWLAGQFDWRAPFILLAVLSAAVGVVAARIIPRLERPRLDSSEAPWKVVGQVLRHGNHIRAFLLGGGLTFAGFLVIPFISPYMVGNVGMTEAQLPLIYLFGGSVTLFSSRWVGKLSDQAGKRPVFTAGALFSLLPTLLLTHLPAAPLAVALAVNMLFMMSLNARFVPAMAMITGSAAPRLRGSFMSVNSCVQQFGSGVAAVVGGLIIVTAADGRLHRYGWVGLISIAATLICIWLGRRLRIEG